MPGSNFDDAELRAFAAVLDEAGSSTIRKAQGAVVKTGADIVGDARGTVAVDTGYLKSTIGMDVDPDGLGLEAGPTAEYGAFVERGTSRMAPQPYLGPAFDRRAPGLERAIRDLGGDIL